MSFLDSQVLVNLALIVLFVVVGGVFAATEIALVSLRDSQLTQLERRGSRGARVAEVARDPNRFLAAVQIGVTVAGFFSAAYGGATLTPGLAVQLERWGLPDTAAETVALASLTLLIAYLSLVLGELVPKRLALQKAESVALIIAPILDRFATLMRPVIWLLSTSTNALVRLLGGDPSATGEQLSDAELRDLVTTHAGLGEHERHILDDVFSATDTSVNEVMRPRGDVEFLAGDLTLVEAAIRVAGFPYSRYPIIGDGFDDVLGFLHVRDLLGVGPDDRRRVRDVQRPVLLLPEPKKVLPAIAAMRQQGVHLAIVVDEYGGTAGIVTLEDLIEELIGDIRDEYDADEVSPAVISDGSTFDGGTRIEDFTKATGVELIDDGNYETVAGFVMARLGRIPSVGDAVEAGDAVLSVTEMHGRRVTRLTWHHLDQPDVNVMP